MFLIEFKFLYFDKFATSLHIAVVKGNINIIKCLLNRNGIDTNLTNDVCVLIIHAVLICIYDFFSKYLWLKPIDLTNNDEIISLFKLK